MKQDPRTIIDTSKDHTFKGSAPVIKKVKSKQTEELNKLYLNRKNAYLPIYVMSNPTAEATVILLPGKNADLGDIINDKPTSINFMSRSRDYFFNENFNVIVVYRASDLTSTTFSDKYREINHASELERVIDFANQKFKKPIWLIGTSRGTLSAVATVIAIGYRKIKGIVLTSTITTQHFSANPIISLDIDKITMPILMVHHVRDACWMCVPEEAVTIFNKFTSSIIKKIIMITGGSDPTGDACLPLHWHGYINYEKETVKIISNWIKKPVS